jgi:hypothetical protein
MQFAAVPDFFLTVFVFRTWNFHKAFLDRSAASKQGRVGARPPAINIYCLSR